MKIKGIEIEDFVNYKDPSLFIASCFCDFKCCKEQNLDLKVCQNSSLHETETKEITNEEIYRYFASNFITKAVVIGGMEPFLQFKEIYELIHFFRSKKENCPFIIYTGYYPAEVRTKVETLKEFSNIIIKFGRFVPHKEKKYDPVLGIYLSSGNQFGVKIC